MKKTILLLCILLSNLLAFAQWNEVGGLNGLAANYSIRSICADAIGNVYAAGQFNNSKGYNYVAKWNGNTWKELASVSDSLNANGVIFSICTDAVGNVYAAGDFVNSSGRNYVAKWNGTTWSELGGLNGLAANGSIYSICSDASNNIYAAGYFINGNNIQYVAKWNGVNWSELGGIGSFSPYLPASILTICTDASGNLYAAGGFKNSSAKYYVAKFLC